jgi:lysophospholipase L1-like esterase
LLLAAPLAAAKPAADGVRVGRIALSPPRHGHSSLLVEVSYPIAMAGHRLDLAVTLTNPDLPVIEERRVRPLANGGPPRAGDRRRRFTFVHRIVLSRKLTREARSGWLVAAEARAAVDANRDGTPELSAKDGATRSLPLGNAGKGLCASAPLQRIEPAQRVVIAMPACTSGRRWKLGDRPDHGIARIRNGKLIYRPAAGFRGTDSLQLVAAPPRGRGKRAPASAAVPVVFQVGAASKAVVRAIGDSVTAGFGYYSNGKTMSLLSLPECKPGSVTLVDACSSNSKTLNNEAKQVEYAPDWGLANNVSWAAQWANDYGVTDFENLAISGSEPVNWAPGGSLYATTKRVESENPDYILMTMGANPLLSEVLFGVDKMGCALWSDLFGKYEECVEEAFEGVHLRRELERLYTDLVAKTKATVYLMQYHLSIPASALAYTAFQIAQMGDLLNREIARAAAAVNSKRLQVVTPPHFNVGIDLEPLYPSRYSCSRFGFKVDGPSVQTKASQAELYIGHALSFCSGPAHGPPWVISGDTGIHPSATGYTQMASQVPAPTE